MKSTILSTRLLPEELESLDAMAEQSGLDRSSMAKSLLRRGLRDLRLDLVVEDYGHGRVTLSRAAEVARMSLWDFIALMETRHLTLHYDVAELEEDMAALPPVR
jgi:predicted HTH domain antitoxin